jgi:hypothetical protein
MSDYFDRVERQIVSRVQEGVPRSSRLPAAVGHLYLAAAVVVVIIVAGVFLVAHGSGGGNPAPAANAGASVTFNVAPGASPRDIHRTATILAKRLHAAVPGVRVSSADGRIVVSEANPSARVRSQILALAAPGRLAFYDWEGDAITPNGKTVASQLQTQNPAAVEISQGHGAIGPGGPGAGSLSRREARALASRQPGSVVLRAANAGAGGAAKSPQFYVLRNAPALSNSAITDPHANPARDTLAPGVAFGFTPSGRRAFEALTASVARRGALVSEPGQSLDEHFAITLDNVLLSVPFIDYKQYPDGIPGENGADVFGSFTTQSAKTLATLLRYGPLPVNLTATG